MPARVTNVLGSAVTGDNLYGREDQLAHIWRCIEVGENVQLLAPRRTGKTSLMLEAARDPKQTWTAIYVNVEGSQTAADLVASLLFALATEPKTATWFEALRQRFPLAGALGTLFQDLKSVSLGSLKVELQQEIGDRWPAVLDDFGERLARFEPGQRLLLAIDELPIPIARLFKDGEANTALQLLQKLRSLRQRPDLRGRVQFMFGGSIGLDTVLRRHNASAVVNDLVGIDVPPWKRETADGFLVAVGKTEGFAITADHRRMLLERLGEAVPFHVQLAYAKLKEIAGSDPARITEELAEKAVRKVVEAPQLRHYAERLALHLSAEDNALCREVLHALCRNRAGLSPKALAGKIERKASDITRILRLLDDEGYLQLDEQSGRLRFRTELLREYWKRREAAYEVGGYR
jgi:AAA+ ATPase superfamily predicted ATPase